MNYTLNFINNSRNPGSVCIYQKLQDPQDPNILSLAWFSKQCAPNVSVKFTWEVNYCFVWSQTGSVTPGVIFDASQVIPADLEQNNSIRLKDDPDYGYSFYGQSDESAQGTLTIIEDDGIPSIPDALVGIGMSGSGAFVFPVQPNVSKTFIPHTEYWIAFGDYQQGEVLAVCTMSMCEQVNFDKGVYSMTANLYEDNEWNIRPTSSFNLLVTEKDEKNITSSL